MRTLALLSLLVILFVVAVMGGCAATPTTTESAGSVDATVNTDRSDEADVEAIARQAREHAQRLQGQDGSGPTSASATPNVPQVQWDDEPARGVENDAPKPAPSQPAVASSRASEDDAGVNQSFIQTVDASPKRVEPDPPVTDAPTAPQPSPADAEPKRAPATSRRALIDLLLADIRRSSDSRLSQALAGAALSAADPEGRIDPQLLEGLTADEKRRVEKFQQVVINLSRHLAEQDAAFDPDTLARQFDTILGPRTLAIRDVRLCRRVSGYGVYDELPPGPLQAGRKHPMIVYAELDHFTVKRHDSNPDAPFAVRLSQEIVLYNEKDGLAVWQHEPVRIVDTSRNRRRDFFIVQLINLPSNLSVGKYVLSVRVNDLQGSTVDERKVPLEVVTDASVVRGGGR